jgi:hypothetical protein
LFTTNEQYDEQYIEDESGEREQGRIEKQVIILNLDTSILKGNGYVLKRNDRAEMVVEITRDSHVYVICLSESKRKPYEIEYEVCS